MFSHVILSSHSSHLSHTTIHCHQPVHCPPCPQHITTRLPRETTRPQREPPPSPTATTIHNVTRTATTRHNDATTRWPATDVPTTPLTSRHDRHARRHGHALPRRNDQHDVTKRPQGVENTANATRQTRRGRRVQRAARTRYARYFFISYPILIILFSLPPPTTPENEPSRSFSGGSPPWQPPPSTTPENKHNSSFSGV